MVQQVLLGLQALFLVLLYLFIWRIVRSAARDLRVPQESFVLAPSRPAAASAELAGPAPRLVVVSSHALPAGRALDVGPVAVTIGRAGDNAVALDGDEFASAHHARVETARDGVWVIDLDSTNGTYVNGERVAGRRRLHAGDTVEVGDTQLRFEHE